MYIAKNGTNLAKKGNFGGVTAEDARYPVIPSIPSEILCDIPSPRQMKLPSGPKEPADAKHHRAESEG